MSVQHCDRTDRAYGGGKQYDVIQHRGSEQAFINERQPKVQQAAMDARQSVSHLVGSIAPSQPASQPLPNKIRWSLTRAKIAFDCSNDGARFASHQSKEVVKFICSCYKIDDNT